MTGLHLYLGNKNYSSWSLRAWLVLKQTGAPFWGNGDPALPGRIARKASPRLTEPARTRTQARRSCTLGIIGDRRVSGRTVSRGLWPHAPPARALARAVSNEMHAGFSALRSHLPMDMRARHPKHPQNHAVTVDIERIVSIWSDCRARFGTGGDFLFGPYTIADAVYAPVVSRFTTYDVTLEGAAARYRDAVWEWPPMQEWIEAAAAEPWIIDTL